MYADDNQMSSAEAVASFPGAQSPVFGVAGLAEGVAGLAGSAALVDEQVGGGRVIAFSIDPNFRAWTQGTQRMLWNAVTGPDASAARAASAGSTPRAEAEQQARRAASALPHLGSEMRIAVAATDADVTARLLREYGAHFVRQRLGVGTLFLVANRRDLSVEEHPFFGQLLADLMDARVDLRWASLNC
jgi:hypothetical protein